MTVFSIALIVNYANHSNDTVPLDTLVQSRREPDFKLYLFIYFIFFLLFTFKDSPSSPAFCKFLDLPLIYIVNKIKKI